MIILLYSKGAFVWDQSGTRIIGIMRVTVCLGAILIPEYLDFRNIFRNIFSFRNIPNERALNKPNTSSSNFVTSAKVCKQAAIRPHSVYCGIERLRVFLLPPGLNASPLQYNSSVQNSPIPIYIPGTRFPPFSHSKNRSKISHLMTSIKSCFMAMQIQNKQWFDKKFDKQFQAYAPLCL